MQFDFRDLVRRGRQVIRKGRGEDAAIVVIDDFLEQRVADSLGDAAVNLAVGNHRIDDAAGILRHQEFLDLYVTGFHVHVDDGDVAGIGEGARRIIVSGLGKAGVDFALEPMRLRIGFAREFCDCDRAVGAGDFRRSVREYDVVGRCLQ